MFSKIKHVAIILVTSTILLSFFNLPVSAEEPPYLQPIALGNTACGICVWPTVCNLNPPRVLQTAPIAVPPDIFAWTSLLEESVSPSEFVALILNGIPYQEICDSAGIWHVCGDPHPPDRLRAYASIMFDPEFDAVNKEKDLSGNVTGWCALIPQVDELVPMSAALNPVIGYALVHMIAICDRGYPAPSDLCTGYPDYSIVIDRITCFACGGFSDICISPDFLDFGEVLAQTSSPFLNLIVSNFGNSILTVSPLQITGTNYSDFSMSYDYCSGKILMPSETCPVGLMFSPASGGSKTANLSITSNDPDTPTLDVPLSGIGTIPISAISPSSHNFGDVIVGSSSVAHTFTVSSTGTANLVIGTITLAGTNPDEFGIQNDNCSGQTIAPSGSCTVQSVFSPASAGEKNANLSIPSNASTLDVPLSGTGIPMGNAPMAPSNLTATSVSAGVIKLTWTDNSTDETSFKIYRKKDSGPWKRIATKGANVVNHTNWTATGNTTTTTYSYYVKACNNNGCSPSTKWATVPYRPTTLSTTASSSNQIDLTWIDTSYNETGFQIYRKKGNCSSVDPWVEITTTGPSITSYSDIGLTSGITYSYKVRAYKQSSNTPYAYGHSLYTGCKSATTP